MAFDNEMLISGGGALKSVIIDGKETFELCLYKFTSPERPDLTNEYFDDSTDFMESAYPFASKALYHHGLDGEVSVVPIGEITSSERRPGDGIYGSVNIDFAPRYKSYIKFLEQQPEEWYLEQERLADEYDEFLKKLARKGRLKGSGGALPQGVVIDDNGHIKRWPQIEYSLTYSPAEPQYTRLSTLKSLPVESFRGLIARETAANETGDSNSNIENEPSKGLKNMDLEQLKQLINEVLAPFMAALRGQDAAGVNPDDVANQVEGAAVDDMGKDPELMKGLTREQVEARVEELAVPIIQKAAQKAYEKQRKAGAAVQLAFANGKQKTSENGREPMKGFSGGHGGDNSGKQARIEGVNNMKYAHLSASDMAIGLKLALLPLQNMGLNNPNPLDVVSEDYYRTMVGKMVDYAGSDPHKVTPFVDFSGEHARHPEWIKSVQLTNLALKSGIPFKANELDASNIATQGQEWVGQWWEHDIWLRAREVRMFEQLIQKGMMQRDIPQGYSTAKFPIEGNDPVVYTAPEANSVDSTGRPEVTAKISPFTTGNVTLTPKEWKAATSYTVVLGEDSVVDVAAQVNYQLTQVIQETIEAGMINADTATAATTNINNIDGTPGTGLSTPYYIAFDGFRKQPLVTNTTYSRDAGNALSLEDYRLTFQKMGSPQRSRAEKMAFIIDADTETSSLAIPELATDDVRQRFATITSGVLRNVYGVDVFKSGFMLLSNTAGKVAVTTPANNKRGTILLVFAPYWGFGYKRQITIETARDILSGSNIYVASLRLGVVARGASSASLSYNIQNGNG